MRRILKYLSLHSAVIRFSTYQIQVCQVQIIALYRCEHCGDLQVFAPAKGLVRCDDLRSKHRESASKMMFNITRIRD